MYRIRVHRADGEHHIVDLKFDKLVGATEAAIRLYLSDPSTRTEVIDKFDTIMGQWPRQTNTNSK